MKRFCAAVTLMLSLLTTSSVHAIPQLDFEAPSTSAGAITYAGGSSPLVGTGIKIANVSGIGGTSLNNLVTLAITAGVLNFTTGNGNGTTFGANATPDTFVITGTIAPQTPAGGTAFAGTAGTLLTGQVTGTTVSGGPLNFIAFNLFTDFVDATLASYFGFTGGIPGPRWSGDTNLSFSLNTGSISPPGTAYTGTTSSGDVHTSPAPEPATWGMAVMGVLSLAGYGWRRRTAADRLPC